MPIEPCSTVAYGADVAPAANKLDQAWREQELSSVACIRGAPHARGGTVMPLIWGLASDHDDLRRTAFPYVPTAVPHRAGPYFGPCFSVAP